MKILFDNVQIDNDYIVSVTQSANLLGDEFRLGSTLCRSITIEVAKDGVTSIPSLVVFTDDSDNVLYTMNVDSVEDNDFIYKIDLLDNMIKLNFNYSAKELIETNGGSASLAQILADMCTKAGITSYPSTFVDSDMQVSWYDSTITAREYVGYIAELNAGYAYINSSGGLIITPFSASAAGSISLDDCSSIEVGNHTRFTKVAYGDIYSYGTDDGDTLYVNINNVYFTDDYESQIQHIHSVMNGFEFNSVSIDDCPQLNLISGQIVDIGGNKAIFEIDNEFYMEWIGGFSSVLKSAEQSETTIEPLAEQIRGLKININRTDNNINTIFSEVDEVQSKITTITGDVNGITVQAEGSDYSSNMNNEGFTVKNGSNEVMKATVDGISANNIIIDSSWNIDSLNNGTSLAFYRR